MALILDTTGDRVIGTPGDEFHQSYADTCAIKSQQIILNEFGIPVTEDQCVQYSYAHGWYTGNGTSFEDVGNLLNDGGISNHQKYNANVFDLMSELSQGHKVIVGVDANELWGDSFSEWLRDFFSGETPNHALIVSGIDTSDPNNIMVYVTDPGNGDHNKSYPLEQFMDAWKDSTCFMVATDTPAPSTSDFMSNFNYEIGHINNVAGLDYLDFQLFHDLSNSLPIHSTSYEIATNPTSSLVNAYIDVANHDISFDQIFSGYEFNDYIDTDVANQALANTYQNGMNHINISPELSCDSYKNVEFSNASYQDFLYSCINDYNDIGDYNSSSYCEQQLHILDYCNSYGIDFYDTFYDL